MDTSCRCDCRSDSGRRAVVLVRAAISPEDLNSWPLRRYPQFIARSETFITRYGAASVFLARFTAVVRAFVPLVSGILRMPPRQFYAANILSAFAWAPAHVFPGVLLAVALRLTNASAEERVILVVGGLTVACITTFVTHSYLRRKRSTV